MRLEPVRIVLALILSCAASGGLSCSSADDDDGADDDGLPTGSGGAGASGSGGAQPMGSGGMGGAGSGGAPIGSGGSGSGGAGGAGGTGAGGSGGSGDGGMDALDAGMPDAALGDDAGQDAGNPTTVSEGLVGWAAESGDGVTTTTGGSGGSEVMVTTAQALLDAAASSGKKVIRIKGTISTPVVMIASDKTLVGVDANATIEGGLAIKGKSSDRVHNVIIQNLRVNGRTSGSDADKDAIHVDEAHHVWVDRCEIWDGGDGNFDITKGSSWVTVSWTKFYYTAQAPDQGHRFSNLIGASPDNGAEDTGRLKVTLHHDWWDKGAIERMPRVRFGQVHVFNSYYSATGNNYAIAAGTNAQIRIENNVFDGVNDPHKFYDSESGGAIAQSGNVYLGASTGGRHDEGGTVFTPPYDYTLDPAANVAAIVKAGAGPK